MSVTIGEGTRTFVAGATDLIGAALVKRLKDVGAVVSGDFEGPIDFANPLAVREAIDAARPDILFHAAGRVAGIVGNQKFPAELIYDNLSVNTTIIHEAYRCGLQNLVYFASSRTYPRLCEQPMHPQSLFTGKLEPTNEAYAVA